MRQVKVGQSNRGKSDGGRQGVFDIIPSYQQWSLYTVLRYCTETDAERKENPKQTEDTFSHIVGRTGGDDITGSLR